MKIVYTLIREKSQIIVTDDSFRDILKNGMKLKIDGKVYKKFNAPLGVPYGHDLIIYEAENDLIGKEVEFLE